MPTPRRKPKPVSPLVSWFMTLTNSMKAGIAAVLSLATLVGIVVAVDARYASAADVQAQTSLLTNQLNQNRLNTDIQFLQQREATLKDRVYSPNGKVPALVIERDKSELDRVIRQIDSKQRALDSLQTGKK